MVENYLAKYEGRWETIISQTIEKEKFPDDLRNLIWLRYFMFISSATMMREASEAGHVVLVEITDVSIYQEIEKELRMLKDWNVDVAGCVGVE